MKLPISPITDFSKLSKNDIVEIEIINTQHIFSPKAAISGLDERNHPIFGSNVYINGQLSSHSTYGLPSLLFPQGIAPLINFINSTKFTTNIHFHGMVNTGLVDGASAFGVFGPSTTLGTNVNIQLPIVKNNSALLWYHSHNKFRDVELIYAGMAGTILITDTVSQPLTNLFTYGNNHIVLNCLDMDLNSDGTPTFANLPVHSNRSCFTVINGISTVQWYTDPVKKVPYSNMLTHNTTENIVKIDILNSGGNWRVFFVGVCDDKHNILPFYVVQTDQSIRAPIQVKTQLIPIGGRLSILVDLTHIKSANVFFYDFDLTENFGMINPTTGTFPDFTNQSSTPSASPIPDPNDINQQGFPTNLKYPHIPLIPQINQTMVNGYAPFPKKYTIRPFLYITNNSGNNNISMENTVLPTINNIIYKNGTPPLDMNNYINNINPNYFYNIPKVTEKTPTRNICLWGENDINYIHGGPGNAYIVDNLGKNVYGVTECCNGANRIRVDLWNSEELDLNQALIEYSKSPNNYKPHRLPTSEFRVTKTDDQYINIAMISNDTFTIQGFKNKIAYGDTKSAPSFSVTITLPPTHPRANLNIQQWVNLLNYTLTKTAINVNGHTFFASDIITFDWSFFPYGINLLNGTTQYIKSAVIKTINKSNYCIRLLYTFTRAMGYITNDG